jgi:hypothetical protein
LLRKRLRDDHLERLAAEDAYRQMIRLEITELSPVARDWVTFERYRVLAPSGRVTRETFSLPID